MYIRCLICLFYFFLIFLSFFFNFFLHVIFSGLFICNPCLLHLLCNQKTHPTKKLKKFSSFNFSVFFYLHLIICMYIRCLICLFNFFFNFSHYFFLIFLTCNFFLVFSPAIHVFCTYSATKKHIQQKN